MTLGNDNGTDGRTDRRTDRVRRNMRPPPREEGRIIKVAYVHGRRHGFESGGTPLAKKIDPHFLAKIFFRQNIA